jgi:hypothetical protein
MEILQVSIPIFFFCSFSDTSLVVFHDAYFNYMARVVLYFRTDVLTSKFGGVHSPHLFLSTQYCISIYTLGIMYHLSLGVGKNFIMPCCTYCECLIMLFLIIGLNFNCDFHFIGELKSVAHMIMS